MGVIVLAENEILEMLFIIDEGKSVELMVPDYIVAFFQRGALMCGYEFFKRTHELGNLRIRRHPGDTIVS